MNQAEQNRAVLEKMHAAIKQGGLTAQLAFFAEHSLAHGFPATKDSIRAVLEDIEATLHDVSFTAHEIAAEGDLVMVRYTLQGVHKGVQKLPFVHGGVLAGIAPTGKHFSVQHVHLFRFKDGLVIEHDAVQDNLGMARQLGLEVATPLAVSV